MFLVALNTSICFDSASCNISSIVLNDVKLPKPVCDLSAGFIDEGKKETIYTCNSVNYLFLKP